MGTVTLDMSMSLDGFIAGPKDDDKPDRELEGLERLHDWRFSGKTEREAEEWEQVASLRSEGNKDVRVLGGANAAQQ